LQESGFNRHKDVFIFNLLYIDFYKVCTFNAICKDNTAINGMTVQHTKFPFPSTWMGHTTLIVIIQLNSFITLLDNSKIANCRQAQNKKKQFC
jgi:hypothetical protein